MSQRLPTPQGSLVLIEPVFDPEKIGSLYIPPAAEDEAPSNGVVVAVGPDQREIEVGFRVLITTTEWIRKPKLRFNEAACYFYQDREIVAFITDDGEVYPRRDRVILRPSWARSGVVQHGLLYSIDRVFEAPQSPQWGTVLRVGEDVKTVKRGESVVIPKYGGNELGVIDRVLYSIKEKDIPGILHAVKTDTTEPVGNRRKAAGGPR